MFRLAHISDPHLGPLPKVGLGDLASKRAFGYFNWQRNRRRDMARHRGREPLLDNQQRNGGERLPERWLDWLGRECPELGKRDI